MKKIRSVLGLLAVGVAPLAHAALQISYQETSPSAVGPTVCGSGPSAGPVTCSATLPGITIDVLSASSNSPGTAVNAHQFGSTLEITTTSAVVVKVWFAAQDFTAPTAPPPVDYSSNLSLTSITGSGTVALMGCVDGANGLAPPTGTFCGAPEASLTNTPLTFSGVTALANTVSTTLTSLHGPYSLGEVLTLTLAAGSNINVITSQVLTPVPEPASIVLLGGVLLLGAGRLIRRNRKQVS